MPELLVPCPHGGSGQLRGQPEPPAGHGRPAPLPSGRSLPALLPAEVRPCPSAAPFPGSDQYEAAAPRQTPSGPELGRAGRGGGRARGRAGAERGRPPQGGERGLRGLAAGRAGAVVTPGSCLLSIREPADLSGSSLRGFSCEGGRRARVALCGVPRRGAGLGAPCGCGAREGAETRRTCLWVGFYLCQGTISPSGV